MMSVTHLIDIAMVATLASFVASMLIVLTQGWHGRLSLDGDVTSIQKFHKRPVPRIGGLAVAIGVFSAFLFGAATEPRALQGDSAGDVFRLLLAGMPAFLAGLTEDLTKRVSVRVRLTATLASAVLAYWLLGAYLPRIDVWGLDALFAVLPLAILITSVAVAGVANSINIIDGFHGVAGSAVVILLAGLGVLAWQAGDAFVARLALLGIGATIGFLLVNYPTGRLFMGDGGAYLMGFWVAEVAVLLVLRNPSINAWQVLAVCAYPIIEVMYSIYRRIVIRKVSPGAPDRLHLHTLVYRRLVCQLIPRNDGKPWIRNAAVALVLAAWMALAAMAGIKFGDSVASAVTVVILEALAYMAVYTRLIRGRWQMRPRFSLEIRPGPVVRLSRRKW